MSQTNIKVLITSNLPAPYSVEFFNLLAEKCDLTVVFYHKTSMDRDPSWFGRFPNKFKAEFIKEKNGRNNPFSLIRYVFSKKYDVCVMYGYGLTVEIVANIFLRLCRHPFIISVDGAIKHEESFFKRILKKIVISSGSKYLSPGCVSDDYLIYYGVAKDKIKRYHFASQHEDDLIKQPLTAEQKISLRKKLGMNYDKVIIAVGNFIYRKGFDILLHSFKDMPRNVGLYIVGGEPTQEYLDIIKDNNIINVIFVGHLGKKELEEYYKASDFCAFPTRYDIWGLVVNEALGCGLPVISTDRCVAALELIKNNYNGFIVPVENAEELRNRIIELLDHHDLDSMHMNSIESIREYTLENMAKEYYECIVEFWNEVN